MACALATLSECCQRLASEHGGGFDHSFHQPTPGMRLKLGSLVHCTQQGGGGGWGGGGGLGWAVTAGVGGE